MKKISAVLLVLVLVGSVAFAGFTGSAKTEFGFDFEDSSYGLTNGTSVSIDVAFLEALGEAKGEGDIYADISASLNFAFSNASEGDLGSATGTYTGVFGQDGDEALVTLLATFEFDHAKIVGENWYVGLLGAIDAPNFATSKIDSKDFDSQVNEWNYEDEDDTYYADIQPKKFVDSQDGIEFGYMDYVVGFGFNGVADDGTYNLYGALKTPEYELGDGLTAQFGASGALSDNDSAVSASAKVAYAADEYSASVAGDLVYDDEEIIADVAVAAAYDIVTLDAYFATTERYNHTTIGDDNLLSVKAVVDLDPLTVTVKAKDIINDQDLSATVAYALNEAVTVTLGGGYVIGTEKLSVSADLAYTADMYSAYIESDFATYLDDSADDMLNMVVGVKSTKLVAGATLYAEWDSDANDVGNLLDEKFGALTVGAKIAF